MRLPIELSPDNAFAVRIRLMVVDEDTGAKVPLTVAAVTARFTSVPTGAEPDPTAGPAHPDLSVDVEHKGDGWWLVLFERAVIPSAAVLDPIFADATPHLWIDDALANHAHFEVPYARAKKMRAA